ncbi:hypothetical protein [Streptomyces albiflavescens]|nr:hypothetical protein [Streptomyces albiflavescens]
MQNVIKEYPDMLIQQHTPPVAEGEWTASVVHQVGFGPDATSTAAVHRHRGGRMVEEYWFGRELTEGEQDPYAHEEPFITITSPDSHLLQVSVDVRPGWSVVVRGSEVGKRSATFTRREDGEAVEQLRFLATLTARARSGWPLAAPTDDSREACQARPGKSRHATGADSQDDGGATPCSTSIPIAHGFVDGGSDSANDEDEGGSPSPASCGGLVRRP